MEWSDINPLAGLAALIVGYLCGSIPFGLLIAKGGGAGDVRSIGSGNIGATNVLRTGRKGLAAFTLLCDALKGTLAVALGLSLFAAAIPAALGAFLGHLFPVWIGFRGGKGIATYVGLILGFLPFGGTVFALAAFALIWLGTALLTRYSSLAALLSTLIVPSVYWWDGNMSLTALFALLTMLTWFMHRANISRLLAGSESKIGDKGKG